MTYREDLKGERVRPGACPQCGKAVDIAVEDDGWDDGLDHYIEYATFECADCGRTDKVRIVYTVSEWIMGWGHREE